MRISIINRVSTLNMNGTTNKKNGNKKIDKDKNIRYATHDSGLTPLNVDKFERTNNFGEIMPNSVPSENIIKKIDELCYEGVVEPRYTNIVSNTDEYNCLNTINKYYDMNNKLRKQTTVFNNDLLLNLRMYNESEFLTYEATVGFPASGPDVSIGRFHYDGTKNENVVKTDHVSFNEEK